ncbi:DUF4129 domain-containing protein [Natrialba swarupiae]|nr:DUF4129 domain-containing protein [Natrialba swarupiae]
MRRRRTRRGGRRYRPHAGRRTVRAARTRAEIRATWHAVLDRVGIENRETRTPGQAAREVLSAGFPPSSVRRLVSIVRDVEYGGRDLPERVADARATATELLAHEPDEEGDE